MEYYSKLQAFAYYSQQAETNIRSALERTIALKPKDEFESAQDYQKRYDEVRAKERALLIDMRKQQLLGLYQMQFDLARYVDSTELFTRTFSFTIAMSGDVNLGGYDANRKVFPVTLSPSHPLLSLPPMHGTVMILDVDSARVFKQDHQGRRLWFEADYRFEQEKHDSISITITAIRARGGQVDGVPISTTVPIKQTLRGYVPVVNISEEHDLWDANPFGWSVLFRVIPSRDGRYAVFFEDERPTIRILDLASGKKIVDYGWRYKSTRLSGKFSFDNKFLVTWAPFSERNTYGGNEEIALWSVKQIGYLGFKIPNYAILDCDISPDNKLLLALSARMRKGWMEGPDPDDGRISIWDISTGKEIYSQKFSSAFSEPLYIMSYDVRFSIGGRFVILKPKEGLDVIPPKNGLDYMNNKPVYYGYELPADEVAIPRENSGVTPDEESAFVYTINMDHRTGTIMKKIDFSRALQKYRIVSPAYVPEWMEEGAAQELFKQWVSYLTIPLDKISEIGYSASTIPELTYAGGEGRFHNYYKTLDGDPSLLFAIPKGLGQALVLLRCSKATREVAEYQFPMEPNQLWSLFRSVEDTIPKIRIYRKDSSLDVDLCDNQFKLLTFGGNSFSDVTNSTIALLKARFVGSWVSSTDKENYFYEAEVRCTNGELSITSKRKRGAKGSVRPFQSSLYYQHITKDVVFSLAFGKFVGKFESNRMTGKLHLTTGAQEDISFIHK